MRRNGAVLFELIVSMAILVGAGMLTLSVIQTGYDNVERAHRTQLAVDVARSLLAELEAGLVNINDLMNADVERVGSIDLIDSADLSAVSEWFVDVETERTTAPGLTLVTLSVFHVNDPERPAAELRQMVALTDVRFEDYEPDEILEGLPAGDGS